MAKNRGQVENLKPFEKGNKLAYRGGSKKFAYDTLINRALQFKTPVKLRAHILKTTGQEIITYEQAILATLVANAAKGSARHIEILYKLKGDFARAEALAKREVEHENDNGEVGSTLLIKVVRREEVQAARQPAPEPKVEIDVTPEGADDAATS